MEEVKDRSSQLPDDILLLILDKMNINEAVKTTILGGKTCGVPSPASASTSVSSPPPAASTYKILLSTLALFPTSYLTVTPQPPSTTSTSHSTALAPIHNIHAELLGNSWLYAINHGVQSFRLHWPTYRKLRLPPAFLTCNTLRELEIRDLFCPVKLPGRLSLPNLKTIHLHTIFLVFDDDHHRMDPFSGLPELEKLTLIRLVCDGLVLIKAPKLRLLEIEDYYLKVKEISAPLLTSFRYKSFNVWECTKVNLPMLEQVYLDIHETFYHHNYMHNNFVRMLHQFGNATAVSLTADTLEILQCKFGSFEQTPTPFPNMKCLKMMKGRYTSRTVFPRVINYLTRTLNCEVELSPGLFVSEHMTDEEMYNYQNSL